MNMSAANQLLGHLRPVHHAIPTRALRIHHIKQPNEGGDYTPPKELSPATIQRVMDALTIKGRGHALAIGEMCGISESLAGNALRQLERDKQAVACPLREHRRKVYEPA